MKKSIYFLLTIVIMMTFCSRSNKNSITVTLEKVAVIGKNEGTEKEIFGRVQDFCLDNEGNLYVLDSEFLNVKVFNKDNVLKNVIGGKYGQGPGEFITPRSIDVDTYKNLYVVDYRKNDLTIFDKSGKLLTIKKVRPKTSIIKSGKPLEVYGLAYPILFKGGLVDYYNLELEKGIPRVSTFCSRQQGRDSLNIIRSGYFGDIALDKKNELFYAFPYPYEIRRFTHDGKFIDKYTRNVPFFKPPAKISGVLDISTGIEQIVCFSNKKWDNLLLCKYYKRKYGRVKNYTTYYFDFWDMNDGKLLGTFSDKDLNLKDADWVKISRTGYLYAAYQEDYPHLVRYKIIIEKIK